MAECSPIGLYNKTSIRSQIAFQKQKLEFGVFGKFSLLNGNAKAGLDLKHVDLAINVVEDAGSVVAMAGVVIDPTKNTYFIGFTAKASALSARGGFEISFLGLSIEVGISGTIGSIGGQLCLGYENGKIYFGGGGHLGVGLDFYIRVGLD